MLNDTNQDCIVWSQTKDSILIKNDSQFAKLILPLYFRHNQMSSFIRQLNKHGFKRIKSTEEKASSCPNIQISEYSHPNFIKDKKEDWARIRWNANSIAPSESAAIESSSKIEILMEQNDFVNNQVENAESRLCVRLILGCQCWKIPFNLLIKKLPSNHC
jgi:heat shock transcription factor 1